MIKPKSYLLWQTANGGTYKKLGNYIEDHQESFTGNIEEGIQRALNGKYAFFSEMSPIVADTVDYCNVTILKEKFVYANWAFHMQKGWIYKPEMDKA